MVPLLCQCQTRTSFNALDVPANGPMAMAAPMGAAMTAQMQFLCRGNPACVRAVEANVPAAAAKVVDTAKRQRSPLRSRTQHQLLALRHNRAPNAFANKRPANGQSRARSNGRNEQRKAAVPKAWHGH
jgi:hypothetical protein